MKPEPEPDRTKLAKGEVRGSGLAVSWCDVPELLERSKRIAFLVVALRPDTGFPPAVDARGGDD
jgi:hypothetical protein